VNSSLLAIAYTVSIGPVFSGAIADPSLQDARYIAHYRCTERKYATSDIVVPSCCIVERFKHVFTFAEAAVLDF
jgi:hypothetical protein